MTNLVKKLLGISLNNEEEQIIQTIRKSGYTSIKVVGRGTVSIDPKEVTGSQKFKKNSERAKELVSRGAA